VKKTAIVMRGIPGSGKSSHARDLAGPQGVIHSTDDFFMVAGEYLFDPGKLRENHAKNLAAFKHSLAQGLDPVVVDNTNSKYWEYKPYVEAADDAGYMVVVAEVPHIPVGTAVKRNTHGVPKQAIERMLARWQPTPHHLPREVLDYAPSSVSTGPYARSSKRKGRRSRP